MVHREGQYLHLNFKHSLKISLNIIPGNFWIQANVTFQTCVKIKNVLYKRESCLLRCWKEEIIEQVLIRCKAVYDEPN